MTRTPEPAPQDNAEIVERCARVLSNRAYEYRRSVVGLKLGQALVQQRIAEELDEAAAAIRALATPIQGEI